MMAALLGSAAGAADIHVHGVVTDSVSGLPLEGVLTELRVPRNLIGCIDNAGGPPDLTDATGAYDLHATQWSSLCLDVSADGYVRQQIDMGSHAPDAVLSLERNVSLVPQSRIEVVVRDHQTGLPVAGALVAGRGPTGADGIALLEALEPGEHPICADARAQGYAIACVDLPYAWDVASGTRVTVEPGTQLSLELALRTGAQWAVQLQAQDTGAPVPDGTHLLEVHALTGERLASRHARSTGGSLLMEGIPPGSYHLSVESLDVSFVTTAHPDVPCPADCEFGLATPVEAVAGDTATVQMQVQQQAQVTGRVMDGVAGLPLFGATVTAYVDRSGFFFWDEVTSAISGPDGRYRLTFLHAGAALRFGAIGTQGHGALSWPDVACSGTVCTQGSTVRLPLGLVTTGVDFLLARGAGIGGSVTSSINGLPMPGVTVRIYADSSLRWRGVTDAQGDYLSGHLEPGSYHVIALGGDACASHPDVPCASGMPAEAALSVPHVDTDTLAVDILLDALPTPVFGSGFE